MNAITEQAVTTLDRYKSHVANVAKLSILAYEAYLAFIENDSADMELFKFYIDARKEWENAVAKMNEIFPVSAKNWFTLATHPAYENNDQNRTI